MPETALTPYAEPLFYFFLRKTGDPHFAEDLAADVLLVYLSALKKGTVITQPHAWVWQVARRRYAAWAEEKHRRIRQEASAEEGENVPAPENPLDTLLHREDAQLLRRELAFIRREYRELIVAYYIQDRSVRDIARSLRLPENTVKTRLRRCRAKIREGMDMAREFGPRSYNPEKMDFVTSGNHPTNLPERVMGRRLPLNILLEASENPSTIEELAMALGVAAPYMEEEVRILVDATLLQPVGDRYVTSFFIMSSRTASRLRRMLREQAPIHTGLVREIAMDVLPLLQEICPAMAGRPDSDLLWWLLPHVHEEALFREPRYLSDLPERSCGPHETWGIVGFEQTDSPDWEPCFMGRNTSGVLGGLSGLYNYDHPCEEMWRRAGWMADSEAALLLSLLRENRSLSGLSAMEQEIWQRIEGRYAHAEGDRAVPDIIVLSEEGQRVLENAVLGHPRFPALQAATAEAFDGLTALLEGEMSGTLRPQLDYVVSNELLNLRMMVLNDCLGEGLLTLPEHPGMSTIGIWLELRTN